MSDSATVQPQPSPEPLLGNGDFDMSFLNDPANEVDPREFYAGERLSKGGAPEEPTDPNPEDPDQPQEPEPAKDGTSEPDAPGVSFVGIQPPVVALMKHFAKVSDLDLSNARDYKVARQLAEKEQIIRANQRAAEPTGAAKNYLDALRDPEPKADPTSEVPAAKPAAPATAVAPASAAETPSEPAWVGLARTLDSPQKVYDAIFDSYGLDEGPEKAQRVFDAHVALIKRTNDEVFAPQIVSFVRAYVQEQLGPLVQEASQQRVFALRESVVDKLSQQEGLDDIRDLFEPASEGTLDVEGGQVADTWLNRAILACPEILDIHEKGRNDAETERLTTGKRYRAAHRVMRVLRQQSVDSGAVQRAVETGQALEKSKRDPVRQALNSGKPAAKQRERLFDSLVPMESNSNSIGGILERAGVK